MGAVQKWDMQTAAEARQERKNLRATAEDRCYRSVDRRDEGRCRVCKRHADPRHHHHLQYRSRGGKHETANVVTLCGSCHNLVHKGAIHLGGNADTPFGVLLSRLADGHWTPETAI